MASGNEVLVVGLPSDVPIEKAPILRKVAVKRMKEAAQNADVSFSAWSTNVFIPPEGKWGVIENMSEEVANKFVAKVPVFPLDKTYQLQTIKLEQAMKLSEISIDDEIKTELETLNMWPLTEDFNRTDFRDWLKDESQREMFVIRRGLDTIVYWFDSATNEPVVDCDGEGAKGEKRKEYEGRTRLPSAVQLQWSHQDVYWSPQGSYLVTHHQPGYRLWAGPDYRSVCKCSHKKATDFIFSPDEQYIMTIRWNERDDDNKVYFGPPNVQLFVARTGDLLKTFPVPTTGPHGDGSWPLFVWSHNSKYVATAEAKKIIIYATPDWKEIIMSDPMYADAQFAWQPNNNLEEPAVMAIWSRPWNEGSPCRLSLLQLPSMKLLTSKNLFAEDGEGKIYWQPNGDYVALVSKVSRRFQGKRKLFQTQIEVVKVRDKSLPVDSVSCPSTSVNLFWSPAKDRFAVLMTDRSEISFYTINQRGCELVTSLEVPKEINCVRWSPLGSHLILASLLSPDGSGTLLFWQCVEAQGSKSFQVETIHKDELPRLTNVSWDPSGRFVATTVTTPISSTTSYRTAGTTCFVIWSFQGRALYKEKEENLHSFTWRPHPPSVVTEKTIEEIRKNMKEYSKKLDAVDHAKRLQRKAELQAQRDAIVNKFAAHIKEVDDWYEEHPLHESWMESLAAFEAQMPTEVVVVEHEEVISITTKPTGIGARI